MPDANPELAALGAPQGGLVIYDQAGAQRRREDWARTQAMVAQIQPTYVARRGQAVEERAREDELIAGAPQRDLAAAQQARGKAQHDVARVIGLLDRARELARSIGREAVRTELIVAEAKEAAVTELILQLAEGDTDPTISAVVPSGHDDRRLSVATEAVERLEGELGAAQAQLADCDRLCRKHACEVLVLDAVAMARELEEAEAMIAGQRANLAALVAVLTDARRAATGSGNSAHMPTRVQRVLVDHADRLVGRLDRGPWQQRFAALVEGEAGDDAAAA